MRPLFIDVELARSGALHGLGAIGPDGQEAVAERAGDVNRVLAEAARWGATVLVGHNLAEHDRPWLVRHMPTHPALRLPFIDTLVVSPLAFPARPYHRLLKEHKLVRDGRPAPLADCRATRTLLQDAQAALGAVEPRLGEFIRAVLTDPEVPGADAGYSQAFGPPRGPLRDAWAALVAGLDGLACARALGALGFDARIALPLAYVAAWIAVPRGSTLPAWVRKNHPSTVALLEGLRTPRCGECAWCRSQTPSGWLRDMFGHPGFRDTPKAPDGGSLQEHIVRAGMEGRPLYAVLPTGTGKSLCFQIPAAARHQRTGALTVVVSPLQSLMKDQVDQLATRDPHATTINGSLTPPERERALEAVRDGQCGLLYLSPEQLRSPAVGRALRSRSIGAWVLDEAHCITDWGHDFRTDYQYVPRFARELARGQGVPVPPFQCFTGTSQIAVTEAIRELFSREVGQALEVYDGGAERDNLTFRVEPCPKPDKLARTQELLEEHLREDGPGAAIVFCGSRADTERTAAVLRNAGWAADAYHAGLQPQPRREVQDRFLGGALRVIAATSAFGMGVDKPDVRLVVHLELPGSLEAYLQQAGRAGRDREPATCVLLFEPADVDRQFRMARTGELTLRDLQVLLRGVLRVPARPDPEGEQRVVSRGEIERMDVTSGLFPPDDASSDTRVTAGIAWLERAGALTRDENHTQVFQGKPRIATLEEARAKVEALDLAPPSRRLWERLLARLYASDENTGLSADDLADLEEEGRGPLGAGSRVLTHLHQMVGKGLISGGVRMAAFLAWGVEHPTREKAERHLAQMSALVDALPELSEGAEVGVPLVATLSSLAERLTADHGVPTRPDQVQLLLHTLSRDGAGLTDLPGSVELLRRGRDTVYLTLRRRWQEVKELTAARRTATRVVVEALDELAAAEGKRGAAVLVGFELDDLADRLRRHLAIAGQVRDGAELASSVLLALHDSRALVLERGLAVFRQTMVLRRRPDAPRTITREAVAPLFKHQEERTLQVHVVGAYAALGAEGIERAQALSRDWFSVPRDVFLRRWFPGKVQALRVPTSEASHTAIVDTLDPEQRRVVTAAPGGHHLVLAGPGSGKTRVLVHRVAWLVRVKRVRPTGIVVLCYTRANAQELRIRLRALIGDDAFGITVSTLHGLALRLTGLRPEPGEALDALIPAAIAVLRGERDPDADGAAEVRDLVLRGATHVLVDEYQDLDAAQATFLEALAGRTHPDRAQRLAVLAVGDDDQSIFEFRGGSAEWVRRFAQDWEATTHALTRSYRCPAPVLAAAAAVLEPVPGRLKAGVALTPSGDGPAVARWTVRAGEVGPLVAQLVARDVADDVAVLAPTRAALAPVRQALEAAGIACSWPLGKDERVPLLALREVVRLTDVLRRREAKLVPLDALDALLPTGPGPWVKLLRGWREELDDVVGPEGEPGGALWRRLLERLVLEGGDRSLGDGVHLGTLHGAKGREWRHVVLVDDPARTEDDEARSRRLWYVGLTRARERLDVVLRAGAVSPILAHVGGAREAGLPPGTPPPPVRYPLLGLGDLWIDALGRARDVAGLEVLAHLPFGAPVTLREDGRGVAVCHEGVELARLARDACPRWAGRAARLRVVAVVRRTAEQSEPAYRAALRHEAWWVPICEATLKS